MGKTVAEREPETLLHKEAAISGRQYTCSNVFECDVGKKLIYTVSIWKVCYMHDK